MARHECLGKSLAGLQLGRRVGGAEDGNAAAAQFIDGAEHERHFRADDDEVRTDMDSGRDD